MSIYMNPNTMVMESSVQLANAISYAAPFSPARPRAHTTTSMDHSFSTDFCIPTGQSAHRLTLEFSLEDHVKRTRKAATYLRQLLHSRACGGICQQPACTRIVTILQHVTACLNNACIFPGCNTTKKLLEHVQECPSGSSSMRICLLCTIAKTTGGQRQRLPSFDDNNSISATSGSNYGNTYRDTEEALMVYDEMIEVSRIPFQSYLPPLPLPALPCSLSSLPSSLPPPPSPVTRAKTYSESHIFETASYGSQELPSKKLRY